MSSDAARAGMKEAAMTSTAQHPPRDFRVLVLIAFAVVLVVNGTLIGWGWWLAVQQPSVSITGVSEPTNTVFCPGETITYQFTLSVTRAGLVDVATSILSAESKRPSYVRLQQFVFDEPTEFVLVRHFVIPATFTDPATGMEVPWQPGKYVHRTIANIEGRSTGADILEVPFVIKEGC